jgi:hypothetical protein
VQQIGQIPVAGEDVERVRDVALASEILQMGFEQFS